MKEDINSLEEIVSAMPPHAIKTTGIPKETMLNSLNLLNQIIERAEEDDRVHKAAAIKNNKASQSIGESWMVFHLKALRDVLSSIR